ncbi:putative HD superfamily hydrolase [Galbibacter orientalis DSM 19592]|uniref:Putative HD superfamily hydrolase n=1 Tax=Galbibacter orientalis DSM 19592 TaxID=926559 RepID=I3C6S2_9FLAO|nr:HD domain-containing protein [Galbibacter orientalis]EIJ39315.1 putative HD superfamily hydrolase [Galbibacter orientalis DSM 19592]
MDNLGLIEKTRVYCKSTMEANRCKYLPFHNWQHAKDVARNSKWIAQHENLPEDIMEELAIASYFHDLGHINGATNHEELSCEYARNFLSNEDFPEERIIKVLKNIQATKMPQNPETVSQKVICDADLAHLGKKNFLVKNAKIRKEWALFNNQKFSDEQWVVMNIKFLNKHNFHTNYAKKSYSAQKLKNINNLKQLLN